VFDGPEGGTAGAANGLVGVEACGVRSNKSMSGDESYERRDDGTLATHRTHDNGKGLAGWRRREGDVGPGGAVTVPPAGAPFVDDIKPDGASLVADGVRLAMVWREGG
jgi:hypothetical protein